MDSVMKSHLIADSRIFFFFCLTVGLGLQQSLASAHIPSGKKMYRLVFNTLICKKNKNKLVYMLMDKNKLFIDAPDKCLMACLLVLSSYSS